MLDLAACEILGNGGTFEVILLKSSLACTLFPGRLLRSYIVQESHADMKIIGFIGPNKSIFLLCKDYPSNSDTLYIIYSIVRAISGWQEHFDYY
jgi:hypothetical protein